MKRTLSIFVVSIFSLLCFSSLSAAPAAKKSIVVLPFTQSAPAGENIEYIQQGILLVMGNKLAMEPDIDVIPSSRFASLIKRGQGRRGLPLEEAYVLGKKLAASYLVQGNIVKIGNSISIDAKLFDVNSYRQVWGTSVVCEKVDDIIPKVSLLSDKMLDHILGRETPPPSQSEETPLPPASSAQQPRVEAPSERVPVAPRGGILTGAASTGLVMAVGGAPIRGSGEGVVSSEGSVWMSEVFPTEFVAVGVGDVTGDNKNEIVVASRNVLRIFRKEGGILSMLQRIDLARNEHILSLDVFDTDGDGISEIIVSQLSSQHMGTTTGSAQSTNVVASFILEYKNGVFARRAQKLPWLLRVIDTAAGAKLVGQRLSLGFPFNNPIQEILYKNGRYDAGDELGISRGLSLYGLALARFIPSLPERVVSINSDDFLCVYEKSALSLSRLEVWGGAQDFVYKSQSGFGGSNSYLRYEGASRYGEPVENRRVYLNPRIVVVDNWGDGKQRLITVRNFSPAGRTLRDMRVFTSSEIVCLEWEGLGLSEFWRTREIGGYVPDFQIQDADNDGEKDLLVVIVKSSGSGIREESLLAIYKLLPAGI